MTEKKVQEIADFYGLKHQTNKTVEELGELIAALSRGQEEWIVEDRPELIWIIEELADVELMMTQVKYLMGIEGKVDDMIDLKIERTLKRMNGPRECGREKQD